MPKSTTTANDTLDALLRAVDPAWRSGSNRFIALHTADPGNAGTQSTSEATYAGYARVSVTAATGFSVASAGASQNTGLIQFPQCTGGTNVITHVTIGTASTGSGVVIYRGALNASLSVANLIQPQFSASALTASES
jgi:hypothetical protein